MPTSKAEKILEHIVAVKGGKNRDGQMKMAKLVSNALISKTPTMIEGGTGIGKALDVDTLIPTPDNGFVPIGKLRQGDFVYDEAGKPTEITHAYETMHNRPCYQITFNNGQSIVADEGHLWNVLSASAARYAARQHRHSLEMSEVWGRTRTVTTADLVDYLHAGKGSSHVPLADSVEYAGKTVPVDPYNLGYWIGANRPRGNTKLNKAYATELRSDAHFVVRLVDDSSVSFGLTADGEEVVGGLGIDPVAPRIPEQYLVTDRVVRKSLLAGIMDASGVIVGSKKKGHRPQVRFSRLSNPGLVQDVFILMSSLALRPIKNRVHGAEGIQFVPSSQIFRTPEKAKYYEQTPATRGQITHRIVSIEKVSSRPVRCISVASPNRLYLATEAYIPTHNSLGYLAGALASEERIFVAPGTKALQDQLAQDCELIAEAFEGAEEAEDEDQFPLDYQPTYKVLKGRSSYLCLNRAKAVFTQDAPPEEPQQETIDDALTLPNPEGEPEIVESTSEIPETIFDEIMTLIEWAKTTETGDRAEAPEVSNKAWFMVCGDADACSGNNCKDNSAACFAELAREEAAEADIVIGNHHYIASMMAYPEAGLAGCKAVVIDEAHEFSSVVADSFGARLNSGRIMHTVAIAGNVLRKEGKIEPDELAGIKRQVENSWLDLEDYLEPYASKWDADRDVMVNHRERINQHLMEIVNTLDGVAKDCRALYDAHKNDEEGAGTFKAAYKQISQLIEHLHLICAGTNDESVVWAERESGPNSPIALYAAQFYTANNISNTLLQTMVDGAIVFTSATLTVGGSFATPAERLGLEASPYDWEGHVVESPFDYQKQGLLYFPMSMPAPSNSPQGKEEYNKAVAREAAIAARAAGGRTLVLCTSSAAVKSIQEILSQELKADGITVLAQAPGKSTKQLADKFRNTPKTVLVGTKTFWTGVSFEGDACRAVVIDKIPFPSPKDPILSALKDKVDREKRGAGFREVYVSEAVLTVVQGAGRLIRTVNDRGAVILCDPRVNPLTAHKKSYWVSFKDSFPPFKRTINGQEVAEFLK